jgi:hypothetical protein
MHQAADAGEPLREPPDLRHLHARLPALNEIMDGQGGQQDQRRRDRNDQLGADAQFGKSHGQVTQSMVGNDLPRTA